MAKANNTELFIDGHLIHNCTEYRRTIGCTNIEEVQITFYPADVVESTIEGKRQIHITNHVGPLDE